jgi:hypothetical protein
VRYIGVGCGTGLRPVAEALGRTPPARRYSPDMARHSFYGTDTKTKDGHKEMAGAERSHQQFGRHGLSSVERFFAADEACA